MVAKNERKWQEFFFDIRGLASAAYD